MLPHGAGSDSQARERNCPVSLHAPSGDMQAHEIACDRDQINGECEGRADYQMVGQPERGSHDEDDLHLCHRPLASSEHAN